MDEKKHILSIGGNQVDHQALIDYCAREHLAVEIGQAEDFSQAVEIISSREVDLVITDFQVGQTPVFDRLELMNGTPWIVLTAHGNENIAVQSLKYGAVDYLVLDSAQSYLPLLVESIRQSIQNQSQGQEISVEHAAALTQSKKLLAEETLQKERIQESLQESREIYRQFFQASPDAAFICSMDGRWIDMNQSALEMFGYQKREEIWKDTIINIYWEPGDQKDFATLLDGQQSVQDHPLNFKNKNGKKIETLISAAPYVIGGKVIGYQGFIRDITAEIKAGKEQQALDQLSQDLGTSLSPDAIYESVVQQIRKLFQPDAIQIHRIISGQVVAQPDCRWQTNNFPSDMDLEACFIPNLVEAIYQKAIQKREVICCAGLRPVLDPADNSDQEVNVEECSETISVIDGGSTLIGPLVVEEQPIALIQLIDRDHQRYSPEDLSLLTRITNLVAIGLRKAYLYQESLDLVKKLTSLQRIENVVLENLSLPTTLDMLVDQLVKELGVDAADILYLHPKLGTLKFITQTGFRQNILQHTDLEIGEGLAGKAALSKAMVQVEDLKSTEVDTPRSLEFFAEEFQAYFGVPLLAKGRLVGVMELFHRGQLKPDQAWLDLLEMVAGLAAIAIDHQNLYKNLERSKTEINQSLDVILEGWAQALELRGIESQGHWQRIVELSLGLAEKLGIEGENLVDIRRGALLHDIGKMCIPDQVLHKGSQLTDKEWELIGRHPVDAYELLKPVEGLKTALEIPLHHHERWDGEGYPHQLSGEEIPFAARLFAVVDVWDALNTDRPYRKAFTYDEAVTYMREQSGKHFDPTIVEAFLEIIEEKD